MYLHRKIIILLNLFTIISCNNLYHEIKITCPEITYTYPEAGSTGIETNKSVMVSFSKQMNVSSINSETLYLTTKSGSKVNGILKIYDRRIAVFKPNKNLLCEKTYKIFLSRSIKDISGIRFKTDKQIKFQTAQKTDIAAPEISTIIHRHDIKYEINLNTIIIVFSKDMDPLSINSETIYIIHGGLKIEGEIKYSSETMEAHFIPHQKLEKNNIYEPLVLSGKKGVRDLAGTPLEEDFSCTITTFN